MTTTPPDLPIPSWARDHHGENEVVTIGELVEYASRREVWARADERRKALAEAIEAVEDTDEATVNGSQSQYCQLGDAAQQRRDCADAIRALIDKEPTT